MFYIPEALAPAWEAFVDQISCGDRELARYLQTLAGYALTGETREEKFFILFGDGGNGKSTFAEVLGDYRKQADATVFDGRRAALDYKRNDLARLRGARLVTASEIDPDMRVATVVLKQLTGEDVVTARMLYKEFVEFSFHGKLWFLMNHMPAFEDLGPAFARRFEVIPFELRLEREDIDYGLRRRLESEAEGVLAWAVEGARRWLEEGLNPPLRVVTATEAELKRLDPITQFVEARCVQLAGQTTEAVDLYKAFNGFCIRDGFRPVARSVFDRRLRSMGLETRRSGKGGRQAWQNLKLEEDE